MPPAPIPGPSEKPGKPEGPGKGPDQPQIGAGQENQPSFKMPEAPQKAEAAPSPMEVAGQQSTPKIPPEELAKNIEATQKRLFEAKTKLNDPDIQNNLTQEHYNALSQVSSKMQGDLKTIADSSNTKMETPVADPQESAAGNVLNWINGSQKTLTGALNYLSTTPKPNVASYMKMQYAVQRATQRAELFSSIVSSSVSGLKTLMSTQLG